MKNDDKPIANPYVVLREEFDDWAVLFDPDAGRGFGLNPAGVYVWKLLDGDHSMDVLLEEIHNYAGGIPEGAGEQIAAFVDGLVGEGLAAFDLSQVCHASGRLKPPGRAVPDPAKRSSPPSRELSDEQIYTYEPPKLVNLNSEHKALGNCYTGAGVCCTSGSSTTGCSSGGGGYSSACGAGGNASDCSGGSAVGCWNPCTGYCCHGPSDSVTCHGGSTNHCCSSGTVPSTPVTCSTGSSPSSFGSCNIGFSPC